jgi:uracil-DNA glycosylase
MAELNQDIKKSILNIISFKKDNTTDNLQNVKLPEISFNLGPKVNLSNFSNTFVLPPIQSNQTQANQPQVQAQVILPEVVKPEVIKIIAKHPFLKSNHLEPNRGNYVEKVEDLIEQKVNYNQILLDNNIIENHTIKFNFDFSKFNQEVSKVMGQTGVVPLVRINTQPIINLNNSRLEINQSWGVLDIITKKPIPSWIPVFNDSYNDLIRISNWLETESKGWFPLKKDLFRAYELTPLDSVRVVIVGQDPYPGVNKNTGLPIANGLAFSTDRINTIPASLTTIYKLMQKTIPGWTYPSHGDLTCWAKQGILMLNKCLTLDGGDTGSHKNLWSDFITRVIQHIDKINPQCIYVLWGNHAQQLANLTTSKNILMSSHPSPQGARFGFNDCNHFNQINELLVQQGKTPIDWSVN